MLITESFQDMHITIIFQIPNMQAYFLDVSFFKRTEEITGRLAVAHTNLPPMVWSMSTITCFVTQPVSMYSPSPATENERNDQTAYISSHSVYKMQYILKLLIDTIKLSIKSFPGVVCIELLYYRDVPQSTSIIPCQCFIYSVLKLEHNISSTNTN